MIRLPRERRCILLPFLASLLLLAPETSASKVTLVEKKAGGRSSRLTFYEHGKRIARATTQPDESAGGSRLDVYEGDVPPGLVYEYHKNKKLKCVWRYVSERNGRGVLCRIEGYYPSGRLEYRFERDGCVTAGKAFMYYENKTPRSVTTFKDGLRHGWSYVFDEDGKHLSEEYYENDKRNGPSRLYHENGQLIDESLYEDGRKNGPFKTYDSTGTLMSEGSYAGGAYEGLVKSCYASGRPKSAIEYRAGKKHGKGRLYYRAGGLKREASFKDGELHGDDKQYWPDGKTLKAWTVYNDGVEVSRVEYDRQGRRKTAPRRKPEKDSGKGTAP